MAWAADRRREGGWAFFSVIVMIIAVGSSLILLEVVQRRAGHLVDERGKIERTSQLMSGWMRVLLAETYVPAALNPSGPYLEQFCTAVGGSLVTSPATAGWPVMPTLCPKQTLLNAAIAGRSIGFGDASVIPLYDAWDRPLLFCAWFQDGTHPISDNGAMLAIVSTGASGVRSASCPAIAAAIAARPASCNDPNPTSAEVIANASACRILNEGDNLVQAVTWREGYLIGGSARDTLGHEATPERVRVCYARQRTNGLVGRVFVGLGVTGADAFGCEDPE